MGHGGAEYATRVRLRARAGRSAGPVSTCSCPVGHDCKHAVAVVVELLNALSDEREIPRADPEDLRWGLAQVEFHFDGTADEESPERNLVQYLRSLEKEDLVELLIDQSRRHPAVRTELERGRAIGSFAAPDLIQEARAEIISLTSQAAWWNSWKSEGELPDYDGLEQFLKTLHARGEHDALVSLGRELFERGNRQVDGSDDDGQTSWAIAECMAVVFKSLVKSSLSDPERLLYALDMSLADDFGLAKGAQAVVERRWAKRTWSSVAQVLGERLDDLPKGSEYRDHHRRDQLSNALVNALDKAGKADEALALCETEAPLTGSHVRLVERLIQAGRLDEAVEWAERGHRATYGQFRGTAGRLRDLLTEIARRRRDWARVAAYAADVFFDVPRVTSFQDLLKAAERAKCADDVRARALSFLETGKRPGPRTRKSKQAPAWPLPGSGLAQSDEQRTRKVQAHWDVLRDLAIKEQRPTDVLLWHDRLQAEESWQPGFAPSALAVAQAVAEEFPDRAVELYVQEAESHIQLKSKPDYASAGRILQHVRRILTESKRTAEWRTLIDDVRETHRRKPRLMEVLDGLEGRPVMRKKRRR